MVSQIIVRRANRRDVILAGRIRRAERRIKNFQIIERIEEDFEESDFQDDEEDEGFHINPWDIRNYIGPVAAFLSWLFLRD